ncbi:hypothetical protein U2A404220006 [Corynebacterium striatum]|nr:hypothetical protein U2A404220006 [Corynebacterium striatum]
MRAPFKAKWAVSDLQITAGFTTPHPEEGKL